MLGFLKNKLKRTRDVIIGGFAGLFTGRKIDQSLLDDLETRLISADVGVKVTAQIIARLKKDIASQKISKVEDIFQVLKSQLQEILTPYQQTLEIPPLVKPYVILVVGVNGVGKTTTVAKIAYLFKKDGKKLILAAADTFRAAAIEQLQTWAERISVPVVAQQLGADSAAVVYDALQSAIAKNVDVMIADTAGRLHTQHNLMAELQKVKKTLAKLDATAPHEILLVLDASIGQNSLVQTREFKEAVGVTGLVITKLDGTAKGGIVFAIVDELKIPVRFVGMGEAIEDLYPFNPNEFVDALLS